MKIDELRKQRNELKLLSDHFDVEIHNMEIEIQRYKNYQNNLLHQKRQLQLSSDKILLQIKKQDSGYECLIHQLNQSANKSCPWRKV